MKNRTPYTAWLVAAVCITTANAAFDVKTFLTQFTPGTLHEENPHGVPTHWNWGLKAIGGTPSRPVPENTHVNLWGQIYVNTTNYHAPNVRVAVKGSQLWLLIDDTWTLGYRTNNLEGGAWKEDFTSSGGPWDMKTESDGSRSFIPADGYNAHFWPRLPYVAVPVVPRAVLSIAFSRLVLDNPSGPDNRSNSAYLLGIGADWRKPDGSCPNNICTGVGVGKFCKVTQNWRVVVFSTMSSAELSSLPMPPDSIFKMPDDTYPGGGSTVANIEGGKRSLPARTSGNPQRVVISGVAGKPTMPAVASGRLVSIHGRVLGAGTERASVSGLKPGIYLVGRE